MNNSPYKSMQVHTLLCMHPQIDQIKEDLQKKELKDVATLYQLSLHQVMSLVSYFNVSPLDPVEVVLEHPKHGIFQVTKNNKAKFCKDYQVDPASLCRLKYGTRKTARGWAKKDIDSP